MPFTKATIICAAHSNSIGKAAIIASIKDIKRVGIIAISIGKNMMVGLANGLDRFASLPEMAAIDAGAASITAVSSMQPDSESNIPQYPSANEIGKAVAQAMMQYGVVG